MREDAIRKEKALSNIEDNFLQMEKSIVQQLYMRQDLHPSTTGFAREDVWESLFEMILPKKFVIEHSVFIIDAEEGISSEVDLAVIDETYTPYIFRYGRIKFIPIEAVAAVIECKSQINSNVTNDLVNWADRIKKLQASNGAITRLATQISDRGVATQKSTRPLMVLCCLKGNVGKASELFDFVIQAIDEDTLNHKEAVLHITSREHNLYEWHNRLNFHNCTEDQVVVSTNKDCSNSIIELLQGITLKDYEITESDSVKQSLLSFHFQFNQLLMLINNPMLFPHLKYVKMFNTFREKTDDE